MATLNQCVVFWCADPAAPFPIGRFGLNAAGDGEFIYARSHIERSNPLPIDPLHLPVKAGQQRIRRHKDGSYGVISDAGPNAWGVKLTSSINNMRGKPTPASPVEWLLNSWHYGSGCLGFSEAHTALPSAGVAAGSVADLTGRLLATVGEFATRIDTEIDDEAARLMSPGTSLGGVRPKTVIMHEGMEHIAKFSRTDDKFDVPAAEYATMRLAHLAGITVPDFELVRIADKSVLLVSRFDRTVDKQRRHYLSANTLVGIDQISADRREYRAGYSYAGIAEILRANGSQGVKDSHQLFRRMVLNILVGNVDDHMRNHAALMTPNGKLTLSPAFDIVPHIDAPALPQAIGVGSDGAASTIGNALSQCARFTLDFSEAKEIVESIREVTSQWRAIFKDSGVAATDIHTLAPSFSASDESERLAIAVMAQQGLAGKTCP